MESGDVHPVFEFISGVFNEFVAPGYSEEGIDEFLKYAQPDALADKLRNDHFGLIAKSGSEIVGVIFFRGCSHVALFFVTASFQREGIGRELLYHALEACDRVGKRPAKLTVNASPNSVDAYRRLDFEQTDVEQCIDGIRFVPMAMQIPASDMPE